MNNKDIIKRIDDALYQLEKVPVASHELRKCMVFAEENLIRLIQELEKEETEKAEVMKNETAEAE